MAVAAVQPHRFKAHRVETPRKRSEGKPRASAVRLLGRENNRGLVRHGGQAALRLIPNESGCVPERVGMHRAPCMSDGRQTGGHCFRTKT